MDITVLSVGNIVEGFLPLRKNESYTGFPLDLG